MIDTHCHILPGIDDGSKNQEMTLEMARVSVASGVRGIICTPHNLNGVFNNTRHDVAMAVMKLQTLFAEHDIALKVYPGAELHLVPELPERLRSGEAMTYANRGKAALVELPKQSIPQGAETILGDLIALGITPIIAHPERNSVLLESPERALNWVNSGIKLQLTAQSCAGDFGPRIKKVCQHFIEEGAVHLMASDAHRVTGRSPDIRPGLKAVNKWAGEAAGRLLTVTNPLHLIRGEPLEDLQVTPKSHGKLSGLFSRFGRR